MRKDDAPPPGWYPDPEGGARLRYWEGLDWSDRFRAPPMKGRYVPPPSTSGKPLEPGDPGYELPDVASAASAVGSQLSGLSRSDSQEIITQVREAARQEAERAAKLFGDQAKSTVRSVGPIISEYTSKAKTIIRRVLIIAFVLVVAYLVFQAWAQASLLDWLGDRIDNLTDGDASGPGGASIRAMLAVSLWP